MESTFDPDNRLGYKEDLSQYLEDASLYFGTGIPLQSTYVAEGYEDCNIKTTTAQGDFVHKIFANNQLGDYSRTRRGPEVADRLIDILLAIQANNVSTPQLLQNQGSYLYRKNQMVSMCYQWINGATYYDLDRAPTAKELKHVVDQVVLINTTQIEPPTYYHDVWATPHIAQLAKKCYRFYQKKNKT